MYGIVLDEKCSYRQGPNTQYRKGSRTVSYRVPYGVVQCGTVYHMVLLCVQWYIALQHTMPYDFTIHYRTVYHTVTYSAPSNAVFYMAGLHDSVPYVVQYTTSCRKVLNSAPYGTVYHISNAKCPIHCCTEGHMVRLHQIFPCCVP